MDLFTHMLVGYMIAWAAAFTVTGYHDYLFAICVLMTMIPDFDMVLYAVPKSIRKRVRGIGHRGVSHTIVFVLVCSVVISIMFHFLVRTDIFVGILMAFLGGISHVVIDGLTAYAFPYLAPFSWKDRSLGLDGAVTGYMVPYSVTAIIAMWGMRAYAVPFGIYKIIVGFVFLGIVVHYLARLSVKLYAERVLYKGQGVKVNPTPTLLAFYVMKPVWKGGVNMVEYIRTRLPRPKKDDGRRYFEVDRLGGKASDMPKDIYEAVIVTSGALDPKRYKDLSNVAAKPMPSKEGEWRMFWFDWKDWNPLKGTKGQLVTLTRDKGFSVETVTEKVSW